MSQSLEFIEAARCIEAALAAVETAGASLPARTPAWLSMRQSRTLLLQARDELRDAQRLAQGKGP